MKKIEQALTATLCPNCGCYHHKKRNKENNIFEGWDSHIEAGYIIVATIPEYITEFMKPIAEGCPRIRMPKKEAKQVSLF